MDQPSTRILPIALIALAIGSFIFVIDWSVHPGLKWPWSTAAATNTNSTGYVCTRDAYICPDGTSLRRQGSTCAFPDCPSVTVNLHVPSTNTTAGNLNRATNSNRTVDILPTYTVAQAIRQATTLNGSTVCIRGDFQRSFEFNAFGSGTKADADGHAQVTEPYIWVDYDVPLNDGSCWLTPNEGQKICVAQVTSCGVFGYAAPGQPGFGHVAAYRYQLTDRPSSP